jgi:hypothetical protein
VISEYEYVTGIQNKMETESNTYLKREDLKEFKKYSRKKGTNGTPQGV